MKYTTKAPSNIAFLKYWGKKDSATQWPANSSLSMTLSKAYTTTSCQTLPHKRQDEIFFQGAKISLESSFAKKMVTHINRLRTSIGVSKALKIETENSFPSSCGLASSASGFAALTICGLVALTGDTSLSSFSEKEITDFIRLGSGSGCRSFHGGYVLWEKGETHNLQSVKQVHHESHWHLCDVIALVSSAKKSISSSEAHLLAWSSPFFQPRLAGINERLEMMKDAISRKDMTLLGPLIEQEALEMHSVIMTTTQKVSYLLPESFRLITWIREQRQKGAFKAYFTIDAGPNIHMICEPSQKPLLLEAFTRDFSGLSYLEDETGPAAIFC